MKTNIQDPTDNIEIDGLNNSDTEDLECSITWDIAISKGPHAASLAINIERIEIDYIYCDPDATTRREEGTGAVISTPEDEQVRLIIVPFEKGWDVTVKVDDGFDHISEIAPKWVQVDEYKKQVTVGF